MQGATRKLLVILVALFLVVPGAAMAQEENETEDDEEDDNGDEMEDDDDRAEREVSIEVTGSEAVFKLEREDAAGEQEVELTYEAPAGEMRLEFEREANGTEESLEYHVELERLIEYEDVNGNGLYDTGADIALSEFDVEEDISWTLGNVHTVTLDGAQGRAINGTGSFGNGATFNVTLKAFGDLVMLDALSLLPTDVKVDLVVTDYPWTSPSSRLALESEVETETEVEVDEEDAATPALNASFGNASAYFEWSETATVDGDTITVQSQVLEGEEETEEDEGEAKLEVSRLLQLNYPQGDEIVHDPKIGVQYAQAAPGEGETEDEDIADVPAPGLALALLAAAAGVVTLRRRRTR